MLVESAPHSLTFSAQQQGERLLRPSAHKRKFESIWGYGLRGALGYPSPPMSSPPSPSRPPPELYLTTTHEQYVPNVSTATTGPIIFSGPPSTYPSLQPTSTQPYYGQQAFAPSYPIQATAPQSISAGPAHAQFFQSPAPGTLVSAPTPAIAGPSSGRGGRKSKAHVASACINCKRAHLSCDVQRPCARCVASGKQDTCYDVQHKKRGRPRLRDEGEFRVEQMLPEQGVTSAGPSVSGPPPPARPIAQTRHRRAESFRSLQSQTSEASSSYGPPTPSYIHGSAMRPPTGFMQSSPPEPRSSSPEVPTALFDLDLVVLRANAPFQQIMLGGQDARGRRLGDIAAPADGRSFQAIRNDLRAEREQREPAYLPPIVQAGQDPLQGLPDSQVDMMAQGFADRTYTWTQTMPGPATQTFPARVRLAKAGTYFVVVTLPSFRPVEQPPPPLSLGPTYGTPYIAAPPIPTPESYTPQPRTTVAQSAPPTMSYPTESASAQLQRAQQTQMAPSRTYPPPQIRMPYQQPYYQPYGSAQPSTPRLPIAEPPTETSPFTPRSAPTQIAQPVPGSNVLLPPIMGAPSGPSTGRQREAAIQQESSSEEDNEGRRLRSPRKRRRMGIDEVLQR